MTSEQDKRWRELAQPGILAVQAGDADTLNGIWAANKRLRAYMPDWAIQQRYDLVWDVAKRHNEYLATFTVRVEVAATGISVLHSSRKSLLVVYRRVYFRYIYEMLKPIVEWAIATGAYDKFPYSFGAVQKVHRLCAEVLEALNESPAAASAIWASLDVKEKTPPELTPSEESCGYPGLVTLVRMAELCHWDGMPFLQESKPWWKWPREKQATWKSPGDAGVVNLALLLQYWPIWGPECEIQAAGVLCSNRIAQAFLAALEAECPTPDWLPRTLNPAHCHDLL